jgi:hypothetical protein
MRTNSQNSFDFAADDLRGQAEQRARPVENSAYPRQASQRPQEGFSPVDGSRMRRKCCQLSADERETDERTLDRGFHRALEQPRMRKEVPERQ